MRQLFAFPNLVNEKAARVVAAFVLAGVILILATRWYWLLAPLAYGSAPTLGEAARRRVSEESA